MKRNLDPSGLNGTGITPPMERSTPSGGVAAVLVPRQFVIMGERERDRDRERERENFHKETDAQVKEYN